MKGSPPPPRFVLRGHTAAITSVAFQDNQTLWSGSADGICMAWSLETKRSLIGMRAHTGSILSLNCMCENKISSSARDGTIKLWDASLLTSCVMPHITTDSSAPASLAPVKELFSGCRHFCNSSSSPDEWPMVLASGSSNQTEIMVWDFRLSSPQPVMKLSTSQPAPLNPTFNATASTGTSNPSHGMVTSLCLASVPVLIQGPASREEALLQQQQEQALHSSIYVPDAPDPEAAFIKRTKDLSIAATGGTTKDVTWTEHAATHSGSSRVTAAAYATASDMYLYAGLEDGFVMTFDVRRPNSPICAHAVQAQPIFALSCTARAPKMKSTSAATDPNHTPNHTPEHNHNTAAADISRESNVPNGECVKALSSGGTMTAYSPVVELWVACGGGDDKISRFKAMCTHLVAVAPLPPARFGNGDTAEGSLFRIDSDGKAEREASKEPDTDSAAASGSVGREEVSEGDREGVIVEGSSSSRPRSLLTEAIAARRDYESQYASPPGAAASSASDAASPDDADLGSSCSIASVSISEVVQLPKPGTGCLSWRDDGKILVSGHWDNTVRVYDRKRLKPIAVLRHHRDGVQAIAFSPRPDHFTHRTYGKTENGTEIAALSGPTGHGAEKDNTGGGVDLQRKIQRAGWFATGSKDHTIAVWDTFADTYAPS